MVINVIWTTRALSHLEAELDYYGKINAKLALELNTIISNAVKNISLVPGIGRSGKRIGTREFVIDKYPYIIALLLTV